MLNKILMAMILLTFVVGCGRISAPREPEGSTYEQTYGVSQDDE